MKTKAFLLGAAALGILISEATAATETITLTMPPGFCLKANPLNHAGGNGLNNVLPNVPAESQVLKYVNGSYVADIFDGSVWLNATTGDPSGTTVSPGEGFFFFNPTSQDLQVTLTGTVPQGRINICFNPGFNLVSSPIPRAFSVTEPSGFPLVLDMQILRFDCATQRYKAFIIGDCAPDGICLFDGETGDPAAPIPVGEGFFIFNPGFRPECWIFNFSVE